MSTPDLHLHTLYLLDSAGRILRTREPNPEPGPRFALIRGRTSCAWAVRADVPQGIAEELDGLAGAEPPVADFGEAPVHAELYRALVGGEVYAGPAFHFPKTVEQPDATVHVNALTLLARHFSGWTAAEIPGRSPIVAVVEDGHAVSVCFCARRSQKAAEAGLETAKAHRGRGFGPQVTAAWALAVRASGRVPLYSTSWENGASLAVARKLVLVAYASGWSLG
ncbi:MAG: GNAT family N-acetyltransferase [Caldilineaceae bacterium SB0670_bin_27]|uniref:GNAT family N-acetyltransferase n=1 Tax=Caldilineaceae bacterium SB0664_bin_27 TaxID=2605260 RepID=A0A6B0YPV4_9CHLR|nr:GNAT family N-acetyltransferase [Caldilineaceae bacterium SB0664_bin_27]MYJ77806.1 GNAT family N-acetyltransferase [Caldilineaceae bacterium SB0670_bin_27]